MKNLRLQKNEEGYSLIVRLNDDLKPVAVEPYVVVSGYDEKTETWDSGSYHQDLEKALDDFNYGKRTILCRAQHIINFYESYIMLSQMTLSFLY